MFAVIGTAGHVDHGKSALLQALTGTHPSHLPQEFARGMTIDLGFASLQTAGEDEIGIIDVPGHERFLRNMVSSLWGLDLVLFVVAADEGWAALTEEHLRVVNALGINRVIVAITKCDLADEQQLQRVEEQILQHFLDRTDSLPDIWRVSSKTGEGIAELRSALVQYVHQLVPARPLIPLPHLYVDRVFTINGTGTTITGTLRGGRIRLGDTLMLYPAGLSVKVKTLQSYHSAREEVEPNRRVALSFRQLKKQSVSRGDCLTTATAPVNQSREWIVQLRPEFSEMKKQGELEIALGTTHTQARCYLLGDGTLARLLLHKAIPAFWGQPMLLMSPGGSHLIGAGQLVWAGALGRDQRTHLMNILLASAGEDAEQTQRNVHMALTGYIPVDAKISPPPDSQQLGEWWVAGHYVQRMKKQLDKLIHQSSYALSVEELAARVQVPDSLVAGMVDLQCREQVWQRTEAGIRVFGTASDVLNTEQQALLDEICLAGRACFDANQYQRPLLQQQLKPLMENKLIVPMEDKLFLSAGEYQLLINEILDHNPTGAMFSIAQAREKTGLARKQLIPLLNRMERDGWVKRVGDKRRIQKQRILTEQE